MCVMRREEFAAGLEPAPTMPQLVLTGWLVGRLA
jgi:hypothetical protein